MSDDDMRDTEAGERCCGAFPGRCAAGRDRNILRAEGNFLSFHGFPVQE
jgi:hypothetical protein